MPFTCDNELEIRGDERERREAAALALALDSVDEDSCSREERGSSLILRFASVDGLPEEGLLTLAPQFPGTAFTLVYFSLDGGFYGYANAGSAGTAAESEDFSDSEGSPSENTRVVVGERYDGDGIAFVRARFMLPRAGEPGHNA